MNRRSFLKTTSVAIGATYLDRDLYAKKYANSPDKKLQKRKLGKTGKKLSIIGFGGIVVKDVSSKFASEVVERSIEKGVNYFDVAPSYGNAEVMLGPALKPFRDKVFLACKTGERDAKGAEKETPLP